MKKSLIIILLLSLGAFLINSCSKNDSGSNGGNGEENKNYFPNTDGAYYKYNVNRTDSEGVQTSGTRSVSYSGMKTGTAYQRQIDTLTITGSVISESLVSESYFRKTDAGVYYFLDTTGLAGNIPANYQQYISQLIIDPEMILLSTPPPANWTVFKILLAASSIINVNATNLGTESFNNGTFSGTALKIKYDVNITIPFLPAQSLSAFCWFLPEIGAAKWEGSATVINALSGGGIDFGDSTTVISQDLIYYDLNQ
jgi:hypothetical protein